MDEQKTYNYAISHEEEPTVALKHLTVKSDSPEVTLSFAEEEFGVWKSKLKLEPEDFS